MNRSHTLLLSFFLLASTLLSALFSPSHAATFPLPPEGSNLIGERVEVVARHHDTLLEIGRHYGVGFNEMQNANPGVDMWVPGEGTLIHVPTQFILPDTPREGVVVNLPEMRLYYYPPPVKGERPVVTTFPISIGRMDWSTPLGTTRVTAKAKNPAWYPPKSVRDEHAQDGDPLPTMVPPGPDNPLGHRAIRLAIPGYLIHGTNRPMGVGMRVTHGCIRMFPEDVEYLFDILPVGTPVHLINEPIKLGWHADHLYIEVHPPLEEAAEENPTSDSSSPNAPNASSVPSASSPSPPPAAPNFDALFKRIEAYSLPIDRQRLDESLTQRIGSPRVISAPK